MLRDAIALLAPAFVLAMAVTCPAADATPTFEDPGEAGPDFAVQGEYVGTIDTDQGAIKLAGQIIALGDGKFQGVGYAGGLPGAGWDKTDRLVGDGETIDGVTVFRNDEGAKTATLKDDVITLLSPKGDKVLTLNKVHRESPTLGAKPPEGAVVLFDGTSPDNFEGLEGEWNECGGIYKVAKPDVNMCYPPLSWQTYDIDFTAAKFRDGEKVKNARITVRHNGVIIHKDVELPGPTAGARVKDESVEPGPVFLQGHGNPVRFRNIWVVQR